MVDGEGLLTPIILANYSDLTRPHPKWWFSKGNPLISGKSRLVKYYNLARIMSFRSQSLLGDTTDPVLMIDDDQVSSDHQNPGWLSYMGDEMISTYNMGIVISQYKYPYITNQYQYNGMSQGF